MQAVPPPLPTIASPTVRAPQQAVEADRLTPQPPINLADTVRDVFNVLRATHTITRTTILVLLKIVITGLAVLMNLFILGSLLGTFVDDLRIVHQIGDQPYAMIIRDGHTTVQDRDSALKEFGSSIILLFFAAALPLLGAYVSHAKRRGFAEGYILSSFFCCIGLIVVLCLPTVRKGG